MNNWTLFTQYYDFFLEYDCRALDLYRKHLYLQSCFHCLYHLCIKHHDRHLYKMSILFHIRKQSNHFFNNKTKKKKDNE